MDLFYRFSLDSIESNGIHGFKKMIVE